MSEREPNSELRATAVQAQAVVDEVDRITKDVKVSPGLKGTKNNSAPKKVRLHNDVLFIRHPEGEGNVDDPSSINLAGVAWDNPDGSRTAYSIELTVEHGMQLTKHIYPPLDGQLEASSSGLAEFLESGDYAAVALNAAADLASAKKDQEARAQERSFGLHIATDSEATELITRLQQMEPVPKQAY